MANTTADKLQGIVASKEQIRQAIEQKGVVCDASTPLASYADKILEIPTGGATRILGLEIPGVVCVVRSGMYETEVTE